MNEDQFFQRAVEITKAHGYDILVDRVTELTEALEKIKLVSSKTSFIGDFDVIWNIANQALQIKPRQ